MPHTFCDADIDRIGLGLLERTLPKAEWTHAAHFAAALWLQRQPGPDVTEYGRSDWLLRYWSRPVLFSVQARRSWVEPDLEPLPF